MIKETLHYKDFNGADRKVDLYFNLTEFELIEIQADSGNGIQEDLRDAINREDAKGILKFVKILIHNGYGIKSADGRMFEKSPEILQSFLNSAAYSPFIMDLFTHMETKLVPFINNLIPNSLIERVEQMEKQPGVTPGNDNPENKPNPFRVGLEGDSPVLEVVGADAPPLKPEITEEDQSEFEAWKAAKAAEEQGFSRPQHESGQGFQL